MGVAPTEDGFVPLTDKKREERTEAIRKVKRQTKPTGFPYDYEWMNEHLTIAVQEPNPFDEMGKRTWEKHVADFREQYRKKVQEAYDEYKRTLSPEALAQEELIAASLAASQKADPDPVGDVEVEEVMENMENAEGLPSELWSQCYDGYDCVNGYYGWDNGYYGWDNGYYGWVDVDGPNYGAEWPVDDYAWTNGYGYGFDGPYDGDDTCQMLGADVGAEHPDVGAEPAIIQPSSFEAGMPVPDVDFQSLPAKIVIRSP